MPPSRPHDQTLLLLEKLVGFPTVSAESNLELIGFVEAFLHENGYETQRLPSACGRKAGLMAQRGGTQGGIMLSAHSDVVPVAGQDWQKPSFALTEADGRLYGRGTTDMKGFLAAMLAAAARAAVQDAPLMLCVSYDEEVGCTGMGEMLPQIAALGWQPDLCIVGEPTSLVPAIGHKGKAAFLARFSGRSGHSALAPKYVNALHMAGDFLAILRDLQDDYARDGAQDPAYDIPYSTVHAGVLQGGTALNIVPDQAELRFELRHLPQDRIEDFLARLQSRVDRMQAGYRERAPEAGVTITMMNSYPGLSVESEAPAVARLLALTGANQPCKVAYGTEAGFFTQIGIPTLVCGPGDMEGQGHKVDEYLEISQLAECDAMLDRLIAQILSEKAVN